MWESENERKVARLTEARGLTQQEQEEALEFLNSHGSLADRLPRIVNWFIAFFFVLYFGGAMIAPFFWKP